MQNQLVIIFRVLLIFFISNIGVDCQSFRLNFHEVNSELLPLKPTVIYRNNGGLLWIGTEMGLTRYDGDQIQIFQKNDNTSEHVSSIAKLKDKYLIGYEDGSLYQFKNDSLQAYKIETGWHSSPINCILPIDTASFWLSSYGSGLYYGTPKSVKHLNETHQILSEEIYSIVAVGKDSLIIATDSGLQLVLLKTEGEVTKNHFFADKLPNDIVTSLYYDKSHAVLWVGTYENGLWGLSLPTGNIVSRYLPDESIRYIRPLMSQQLLIGTTNVTGCFLLDKQYNKIIFSKFPNGKNRFSVYDCFVDSENRIWWLCKYNGLISADGMFQFSGSEFKNVQTLLQQDSSIYIANEDGLFKKQNSGKIQQIAKNVNILTLCEAGENNALWCGTFGSGILIFNPVSGKIEYFTETDGLINNNVLSILRNGDEVWAATLGGITIINTKTNVIRSITNADGLNTGYNYRLFKDSKNAVWIGSDGYGIIKIRPDGSKKNYTSKHKVYSITEDSQGRIWYSTPTEGVVMIEGESLIIFDKKRGLSDDNVSGLVATGVGNIMVFHPKGFDLINTDNFQIVKSGHSSGVNNWELNINAYIQNKDGDVIFYTPDGMWKYKSENRTFSQPALYIKSFFCGNTDYHQTSHLKLDYNQNDIQVNFTGIWYDDPKALRYRYKLEGVENEWRYTKDKKIIYSNLVPGTYKLLLECDIHENFNFADRYEKSFTIRKPYWETIWFYIIFVTFLLAALYFIIRNRDLRKRQLESLKTEQVRNQLEILKSQINPHFLFNSFNTLISTIEIDQKAAVKYAEKMSDFYRHILEYRDKDLIPLDEELDIARDYLFLLETRFGNNLQIKIDVTYTNEYLIIPLTLQILLENAIKHNIVSKNNPLYISITQKEDNLAVMNNFQPRMDNTTSTHFGIRTLQSRYKLTVHKDLIVQQSDENFLVIIPLKPHKENENSNR
ncbi:MAG: histidine kinase [Saprospiraceae bacterium]|nr:histidine kinase [Saprospiraceae bacterium]